MYITGTGVIKVVKKKDIDGSDMVFFNVSGSPQKHTKQLDSKNLWNNIYNQIS